MNERLTGLYKQALEFAYNSVPKEDWNTGIFHPNVSGKFAELIVRECYDHCKGQLMDRKTAEEAGLEYNDGVGDCAVGLLQHFGVKE